MTEVTDALADLDMAHDLICEAKGADGPNGGFVTDHLDAADHWIGKVRDFLEATLSAIPIPAPTGEVERLAAWFADNYSDEREWEDMLTDALVEARRQMEQSR